MLARVPAWTQSFVGAPHVPAFNPHLPRHGLALSRTADADPPRLIGWRSLHHRIAQSSTFSVTAWAPSTKLQALVSGWLDPGSCPLSRTDVFPRPALTPTVRTALAPNGLRTALLTIQNVFSRISELYEFYSASRCYLPGCPREASNTAYPFSRHLSPFGAFSPRPLVKGCLGSCRARPRFSVRAFRRHTAVTKDTSDRLLQSHMSKMSTRTSRGY